MKTTKGFTPAPKQMGPIESVPPHSTPGFVVIGSSGAQPSILTEYTQDADGYWWDAMDIRYSRIKPVRPGDAPTYIEAGIVDAFRTVERVIDWYHDEEALEGPLKIASQVAVVAGENEDPSSTPDPLTSDMHRDVETMESDPGWLQGIGRLDHHIEGDYYVNENSGMWVSEDIPIGMHAENYDRWGSQAGRVYLWIDQIEAFRRQMEHHLYNR